MVLKAMSSVSFNLQERHYPINGDANGVENGKLNSSWDFIMLRTHSHKPDRYVYKYIHIDI